MSKSTTDVHGGPTYKAPATRNVNRCCLICCATITKLSRCPIAPCMHGPIRRQGHGMVTPPSNRNHRLAAQTPRDRDRREDIGLRPVADLSLCIIPPGVHGASHQRERMVLSTRHGRDRLSREHAPDRHGDELRRDRIVLATVATSIGPPAVHNAITGQRGTVITPTRDRRDRAAGETALIGDVDRHQYGRRRIAHASLSDVVMSPANKPSFVRERERV